MRYLSAWPAHAQLVLVEILAVGPVGFARHEDLMNRLAARLADCAPSGRTRGSRGQDLANARFGALHRIVQQRVVSGQHRTLPRLTPMLCDLATQEGPSA